ncbi:MAG: bacterioferritin-associated ferredoxin [Mycobacteriales bacterium]
MRSRVLVCHCHRVSDAQVDTVLDAGASTLRSVAKATHAGTGCGNCIPALRELCDAAKLRKACPTHGEIAV